jgi:hypothetical protein
VPAGSPRQVTARAGGAASRPRNVASITDAAVPLTGSTNPAISSVSPKMANPGAGNERSANHVPRDVATIGEHRRATSRERDTLSNLQKPVLTHLSQPVNSGEKCVACSPPVLDDDPLSVSHGIAERRHIAHPEYRKEELGWNIERISPRQLSILAFGWWRLLKHPFYGATPGVARAE